MGYKKREPVSRDRMKRRRYAGHNTICQKLREIWAIADRIGDEEIELKSREAMAMAKAMQDRLKWYAQQQLQSDAPAGGQIPRSSAQDSGS